MSAEVDANCAYSLPHYRFILRKAQETHALPRVRDVAFDLPEAPFFLVRHDVDITPWAALAMAELEHDEGVTTTYYFRVHAPYYNLSDARVIDVVHRIVGLDHEVGLHYEPGFFLDRGLDPIEGTRRDIRFFEETVGIETKTIAQHQPAEGPVLGEISEHHADAYRKDLVFGIPYFGDSGFHWREGCVCTKLEHPQLHTLIHPHSWVIWDRGWQDVLRAHADDLAGRLRAEMEAYIASVELYLDARPRLDAERQAQYEREQGQDAG